jgi:hypothetical protein
MKFIILFLCMMILTACEEPNSVTNETTSQGNQQEEINKLENEEKSEQGVKELSYEDIIVTFQHPKTDQTFKIVNAYKLYEYYIKRVNDNPHLLPSDLFKKEVYRKTYIDCLKGSNDIPWDNILMKPEQFDEIKLLTNRIEKGDTTNLIKASLIKSSNLLPSNVETTVCVFPAKLNDNYAVTLNTGKILLLYNREYSPVNIKVLTAHEYHHSIMFQRFNNDIEYSTILDNLILEGKAVMYEKLVYPTIKYSYIYPNNKKDWAKIEEDLLAEDWTWERYDEILFGGNDLPKSYGYSEGYKMVKAYLDAHPNLTIEEWSQLSGKEIFEEYKDNYK